MSEIKAVLDILAKLVAFDTTSAKTNLPLIDFVARYLDGFGVGSRLVKSEDGAKANLFATVGPPDAGGVGLSGHTDVVPVVGQSWDGDPFTLIERDGRLYGRGTADMKGFLACALAAVPDFAKRRLRTPIHLIFSYDEEIGCVGVRPLIAEIGRSLPRPRLVIVGEPTSMRVVDAHKGPMRWEVRVTGRAAHSSMAPLGVNAIAAAAVMLAEVEDMARDLKASATDARFNPSYTTSQVTQIAGGTASNIVPESCVFGFDVRALPGFEPQALERRLRAAAAELLPAMRRVAPEADIEISRTNEVPPFAADPASGAVALALRWAGGNETHAVSYGTEAGLFQDAGAPSVVCGPGSIEQAHTANEWVAVEQLERCMAFLGRVAEWAEEGE